MTILDCDNTIYDNLIEYYFHEYFENRNIDISGMNYKSVDNSLFEGAFRYIYKKLFKPDFTTVRYNNKNTKIDLNDIDLLHDIADIYTCIIKDYNIIPFDIWFINMLGISRDTFNSWKNEEYSHGGLSSQYSDIYKKIHDLSRQQTQNKLADDRIGIQSLANNDQDVGLRYNQQRQYEAVEAHRIVAFSDLPALKNSNNSQLIEKSQE